jgi:hypothetical protein
MYCLPRHRALGKWVCRENESARQMSLPGKWVCQWHVRLRALRSQTDWHDHVLRHHVGVTTVERPDPTWLLVRALCSRRSRDSSSCHPDLELGALTKSLAGRCQSECLGRLLYNTLKTTFPVLFHSAVKKKHWQNRFRSSMKCFRKTFQLNCRNWRCRYRVPNPDVPNHRVQNHKVPNHKVPNPKVPNHKVPNHKVPNHKVPNHKVPNYKVPNWQHS